MYILVLAIIVLSILVGITFHEFGHMFFAKVFGVKVDNFVIGWGKPFVKWHRKNDPTEYGIAPCPMGGYCNIDDESLNALPFHKYFIVLMGGVINNIILGLVECIAAFYFVAGTFLVNPIEPIVSAGQIMGKLFVAMPNMFIEMFNFKSLAVNGGVLTSMSDAGTSIVSSGSGALAMIGTAFVVGGAMNFVLGFFNALPIPALDGGHVVLKIVRMILAKFGKSMNEKIVNRVCYCFMGAFIALQLVYLLFDLPVVRNLFL